MRLIRNLSMLLVWGGVLLSCGKHDEGPDAIHVDETADHDLAEFKRSRRAEAVRQEIAKARDSMVAALRSDLSAPWTSLIVACRYDCSCTGTTFYGFKIVRENESISVAPWKLQGGFDGVPVGPERVGAAKTLTKGELDKLLSEVALYFLVATRLEDPLEKVGPPPTDRAKAKDWEKAYVAADAHPLGSDHIWIEIRIATPDGVNKHANLFDRHVPQEFWQWIEAFGKMPDQR